MATSPTSNRRNTSKNHVRRHTGNRSQRLLLPWEITLDQPYPTQLCDVLYTEAYTDVVTLQYFFLPQLLIGPTVDHSVLPERLSSWFGISSLEYSWRGMADQKLYLLNRSFCVNIENSKSSVFQLLYRVSQGSVLGLLNFILRHSFHYCHTYVGQP